MKKKRFYHVVTERPMELNQIILFDENHFNGVANRVNKVNELKKTEYVEFEKLSELEKMIYGNLEHWVKIADREIALEEVRKKNFKNYPSRMACLYVSTSLEDAKNWAEYFISVGRKTFQIVALENEGNCFTGDAHNCWYDCESNEEAIKRAFNYWRVLENEKNEEPVYETIIDGKIKVVEIIKDYRY